MLSDDQRIGVWDLAVFGIIKEQQGVRRFLLRGIDDGTVGWTLMATAFNLQIVWPVWRVPRLEYAYPG